MTIHFDEDLAALLAGELSGDATRCAMAHLRHCGECTSALIDVAVAHGSLRSAHRNSIVTPSEQVEPLGPLVIPAPRWTKVVTLAASVIVVVALGIALVSVAGQSSSPKVSAVASLRHLDGPVEASGSAVVHVLPSALEMSVSTRNLPAAPPNHYYEVWLLDPTANKMLPLGLLSPKGSGTFSIAKSLMIQFPAVDVSLQANNGVAAHSNVSVLRGDVRTV